MLTRTKAAAFIPIILLIALCVLGLWKRQAIIDYAKLYNYAAPASVVELADNTTLTASSRRVFYVNHPAIQDRDSFTQSCSSLGEHTIVLGCYHPVDRGIYVFHVTDDRLSGVDQVTAAHELLHAEYDRLNSSERTRINTLLENYYHNSLTDERIKSVIETYKKTEPNDVTNEMHSVFGTEVADLPPELETYYKNYFTDRQKIVRYASDYQAEFTSRQEQVKAYDAQLGQLKQTIETNTASLDAQQKDITESRSRLDADRASDNFARYNAAVPGYNNQVDTYNTLLQTTKATIATYNDIVNKRNAIALQVTKLAQSIDSSFQTIQ